MPDYGPLEAPAGATNIKYDDEGAIESFDLPQFIEDWDDVDWDFDWQEFIEDYGDEEMEETDS